MAIIKGTSGNDVLYGDGQSQIQAGDGNDTIYLTGASWEAFLDPGNDTFRVARVGAFGNIGLNFEPPAGSRPTTAGALVNFTTQPISVSGRTLARDSALDPWGGVDTFELPAQVTRVDYFSGPEDDVFYVDERFVLFPAFNLWQDTGDDKIFSRHGPYLNFFSDGQNYQIKIDASTTGFDIETKNGSVEIIRLVDDPYFKPSFTFWGNNNSGSFNIVGSDGAELFIFGGGSSQITAGRGSDSFQIGQPGSKVFIYDFQPGDELVLDSGIISSRGLNFQTATVDDVRRLVSVSQNPNELTTTYSINGLNGLPTSSFTLAGLFSAPTISKDWVFHLVPENIFPSVTHVFGGYSSKPGRWLVHDVSKAVALTSYPDLVSFLSSSIQNPISVSGFQTGTDLIHLWSTDAPAGGVANVNLEANNFASGPGLTKPRTPVEYVLHDTSSGTVYFDQDGSGPSPTWASFILDKGSSLAASDIQISKPQSYALEPDRATVAEGEAVTVRLSSDNVAAGTVVPYTVTGISSFDLAGFKLTGSLTVDALGEALLSIPLAADAITEGPETLKLEWGGQTLSFQVNDTSRSSAEQGQPTYALAASAAAVDEGGVAVFTITTTNVAAGTALSYSISGVAAADLAGGQLAGVALIDASGRASLSIPIAADNLTEGSETLLLTAQGVSASIRINDTSTALKSIPASFALVAGTRGYDISPIAGLAAPANSGSLYVVKLANAWTAEFRASTEQLLRWFQSKGQLLGLTTNQILDIATAGLTAPNQFDIIQILGVIADADLTSGTPRYDGVFSPPVTTIGTPDFNSGAGGGDGGGGGG